MKHDIEIDYLSDGFNVAYILRYFTEDSAGKIIDISTYQSPFVFKDSQDAYHAAIEEIAA